MRRSALVGTLFIAAALSACGGSAETEGAGENSRTSGEPGVGAGREIAFARSEGTTQNRFSDIYLMNVDGSGKLNLTRGPDADNHPAFSPDGSRIAFSREAGEGIQTGGAHIRVIGVDGGGEEGLTRRRRCILDTDPTWSPDGEQIAFTRMQCRFDPDAEAFSVLSQSIYVMDADGTAVTQLTDSRRDGQPAWSPDGERIAFSRRARIWIINPDGSGETNITGAPAFRGMEAIGPSFSPDGERIAFLGHRERARTRGVWVMSTDGSDPALLKNSPRTGLNSSAPAWSPDGRRIAFVGERDGPGIYVTNSDGTDQHRLRGGRVNDTEPAWSPASNGTP